MENVSPFDKIRLIRCEFVNKLYSDRNTLFTFDLKHGTGRRISHDDMGRKKQNGGLSGREGDRTDGCDRGHVRRQCSFSHVW